MMGDVVTRNTHSAHTGIARYARQIQIKKFVNNVHFEFLHTSEG